MSRGRALGVCLLVALAIWVFVYKAAPQDAGLRGVLEAASRAAHAESLYRPSDGHYQFKYLPAFAVLSIPLGRMPLATAKVVWFATSVALLVTLLALAVRLPVERRKPVRWLVAAHGPCVWQVLRARARARPGQSALRGHRHRHVPGDAIRP